MKQNSALDGLGISSEELGVYDAVDDSSEEVGVYEAESVVECLDIVWVRDQSRVLVRLRVVLDLLDESEVDDDTESSVVDVGISVVVYDSTEVKVIQEMVEMLMVDEYTVSVSVRLLPQLVALPGGI
ncbi:unnamed protein product [Alternaria alternata]